MENKMIAEPVILLPNQQATFIKDINEYKVNTVNKLVSKQIEKPNEINKRNAKDVKSPEILYFEEIDSKLYTSWKDGKLIFQSEKFSELALRMERWYDMRIDITDQELKEIKFTGVLEKETIEQALNALSLSFPFHYEIDKNKVTISKAGNI
jgi:ferric-dicitrate binding protein FerR (iron transport regulator)